MKKLILTPTKDSITICLPADWVGKPISCILHREEDMDSPFEVGEPMPSYNLHHSRIEENWDNAIEDELWKNI